MDFSKHLGSIGAVDGRVERELKARINEAEKCPPCTGLVLDAAAGIWHLTVTGQHVDHTHYCRECTDVCSTDTKIHKII